MAETPREVVARLYGHTIKLEVAETPELRARGLSLRTQLPPDTGMLFIFDYPDRWAFQTWETYIPLVAYWLDAQGFVREVTVMEPLSSEKYAPSQPVTMVIEMPYLWASTHAVPVGAKLELRR